MFYVFNITTQRDFSHQPVANNWGLRCAPRYSQAPEGLTEHALCALKHLKHSNPINLSTKHPPQTCFFICNLHNLLGHRITAASQLDYAWKKTPFLGSGVSPGSGQEPGSLLLAEGGKNQFLGNMPQGATVPGTFPFCCRAFSVTASTCFFLNTCIYKLSVATHHIK